MEKVYLNCIGENEAGIDTLQMLTNIENRLEELFEKMQKMPAEKLTEAEKVWTANLKASAGFFLLLKYPPLPTKRIARSPPTGKGQGSAAQAAGGKA